MKQSIKTRLEDEMKLFFGYAIFFMFFFSSFTFLRLLSEGIHDFSFYSFGYNFIESLILAKLVLLGQHFKLGENYQNRSLIIPTIYKAAVFSLFIMLFSVIEEVVIGLLRHKNLNEILDHFLRFGWPVALSKVLLMSFVLIFLFSFLELSRVLGGTVLFNLFFNRKPVDE